MEQLVLDKKEEETAVLEGNKPKPLGFFSLVSESIA